jgi:hypothetical protein
LASSANHSGTVFFSVRIISHRSVQKLVPPMMYLSNPPALIHCLKGSLMCSCSSLLLYGSNVLAFMGIPLLSSITNLQMFIDKESVLISRTMESIGLLFAVEYAIKHSCCRLYLWWVYPVRLYFFLVLLLC